MVESRRSVCRQRQPLLGVSLSGWAKFPALANDSRRAALQGRRGGDGRSWSGGLLFRGGAHINISWSSMKYSFLASAFLLYVSALPLTAEIVFTSLSSSSPAYNGNEIDPVGIAGSRQAIGFTAAGAGSEAVTEIDLAVWSGASFSPPGSDNLFDAAIYTDSSGAAGTQVANAFWALDTSITTCCSLVSVTGIEGVVLTGGTSYFMVLSGSDANSSVGWAVENAGVPEDWQTFESGSWIDHGTVDSAGAFDIIAAPEPGAMLLTGAGLAGLAVFRRKRALHRIFQGRGLQRRRKSK
jgi:hypothetical protein